MIISNNSLEALRNCHYIPNTTLNALVSDNLYLSVVATNACQCNCAYCINSLTDKSLSLPIDKAKENITKAVAKFGIKEAVILGGEPTIYPHLFELIQFLKETCKLRRVGITTNGIALKDEAFLIRLVQTRIDFLNLSFHDDGEFLTVHELKNIYNTFKAFATSTQKLRINTNIWRGNHDTPSSLINFLEYISAYCDEIRVSNIIRKDAFSVNPQAVAEAEPMYMTDAAYTELFRQIINHYAEDYTIIHNPAALGFVHYYLIPRRTPIIINWNIDSKVSEQVCENNLGENKIHTIKCLVTGDISLSWNEHNIVRL